MSTIMYKYSVFAESKVDGRKRKNADSGRLVCKTGELQESIGVKYMTVSIWLTAVIAVISLMAGLWIGRSIRWMAEETEEQVKAGEESDKINIPERNGKRIPLGWCVSSPASGVVKAFFEGSRCGALIQPEAGEVFAPVAGRILKLYPMGSAMLIAADFGKQVLLKAGSGADDLCSMYYRSKVVQNEIITKGKLLLEFDKEGLENRGVDVTVAVSMETGMEEKSIVVTQDEHIKVGEELMWG